MSEVQARRLKKYSNEDQVRAYCTLHFNDQNLNKTKRELGMPLTTLAFWKKRWDSEGFPEGNSALALEMTRGHVRQATDIRNLAMKRAIEVIPESTNLAQLSGIIKTMDEQIRLAHGLATSITEKRTVNSNDNSMDLDKFFSAIAEATHERQRDIEEVIDVEVDDGMEQAELPALLEGD